MSLLRVRIVLRAPLGTPLTSGTLFGHLCWAKRETETEAALVRWLGELAEAPWALSDGVPAGVLPRPLLRREPLRCGAPMTRDILHELEEEKRRSKLAWVSAGAWPSLRAAVTEGAVRADADRTDRDAVNGRPLRYRVAHNTIDRLTGSTPDEGGLFFVDEIWNRDAESRFDVYVRADANASELLALFSAVGESGFGRDATWGRGHFEVVDVTEADWLDDHAGNRMMSLSHGCLTPNMIKPRYSLFTHFGKVGAGLLAEGARAWKYPILLTKPGSTFEADGDGPFGAWLTGVHQDRPEVGHNAFHLAIPFTESAGADGR